MTKLSKLKNVVDATCDRCGQPLANKASYDLWLMVTTYDETGDYLKTMMDPGDEVVKRDYIGIGIDCCGKVVAEAWDQMINNLNLKN